MAIANIPRRILGGHTAQTQALTRELRHLGARHHYDVRANYRVLTTDSAMQWQMTLLNSPDWAPFEVPSQPGWCYYHRRGTHCVVRWSLDDPEWIELLDGLPALAQLKARPERSPT